MGAHAVKYQPSAFDRTMGCPGSHREIAACGLKPRTSPEAQEGTDAHTVAARRAAKRYNVKYGDPAPKVITEEMVAGAETYVEAIDELLCTCGNKVIAIEEKIDLSSIAPGMFGTGDFCSFCPSCRHAVVVDYKFGKGLEVPVVNNPQLQLYMLGWIKKCGVTPARVTIAIVQPRAPSGNFVKIWEPEILDLMDFRVEALAAVAAAEKPDAPLNPGSHCRWCTAGPVCPALREQAAVVAKSDFAPITAESGYSVDDVARYLAMVPKLRAWCDKLEEFAEREARAGVKLPGFKLVEGRPGNRRWVDETEAAKELELDLGEAVYDPRSLKSPAQIEKLWKQKLKDKPDLTHLTTRSAPGIVLVAESDRRTEVTVDLETAEDEFRQIEEGADQE